MILTDHHTATEAVIYLKNGKRKYGLLIDNSELYHSYRFISNDKIVNTNNYEDCIELVCAESIEAIDINLK